MTSDFFFTRRASCGLGQKSVRTKSTLVEVLPIAYSELMRNKEMARSKRYAILFTSVFDAKHNLFGFQSFLRENQARHSLYPTLIRLPAARLRIAYNSDISPFPLPSPLLRPPHPNYCIRDLSVLSQVQLIEGCACHPHPLCREAWVGALKGTHHTQRYAYLRDGGDNRWRKHNTSDS